MLWFLVLSLAAADSRELPVAQKYVLRTLEEAPGVRVVELDFNQDKKLDRRETFKNGVLVKLELDRAFKGKLNETIEYFPWVSPNEPISIKQLDLDYNLRVDQTERTFRDPEKKLIIITHELSSKRDGTFDRKWTTRHPLVQHSADCQEGAHPLPTVPTLPGAAVAGVDLPTGYTTSGIGLQVHSSCFEKWGRETFSTALAESFTTGKQCLEELATRPTTVMNRVASYLPELERLWENDSVKVSCGVTDRNWSGAAAFASVEPDQVMPGSTVVHPFMAINPSYPATRPPSSDEVVELKNVLFHEQLHNLGLRHGTDIEAPYACAACCISSTYKEGGESDKAAACKVCVGDYSGPQDQNYIRDMIAWGDVAFSSLRKDIPTLLTQQYLYANPGSRWGLLAMAQSLGSPFSPVGSQLAQLVKERTSPGPLTAPEQEMFSRARRFEGFVPEWSRYSFTTDATARAIYAHFGENNRRQALEVLERNKEAIRVELNIAAAAGTAEFTRREVRNSLKRILFELFPPQHPPPKSLSDYQAVELYTYFGLGD